MPLAGYPGAVRAILAILLVLMTACTTVRGSLKTAGVATLGAFSGFLIAATGEKPGCACPTTREVAGGLVMLGGGSVAVVSLIAAVVLAIDIDLPSPSASTPGPADAEDPLVIHERVWGMTREAAGGTCARLRQGQGDGRRRPRARSRISRHRVRARSRDLGVPREIVAGAWRRPRRPVAGSNCTCNADRCRKPRVLS